MSATSGISRCQNLSRLLVSAHIVAGLLFCPSAGRALPRSPFPPVPEAGVIFHEGFDGFHSIGSGDARAVIPGLGTLVESWSGYALQRAGTNVLPWILPAVDPASGHTNLTCDADGAIRFWFEPRFSSASIAGGTGPGGNRPIWLIWWRPARAGQRCSGRCKSARTAGFYNCSVMGTRPNPNPLDTHCMAGATEP